MKALGPIFQINGSPSPKMKMAIKARMEIEEKAINKSIFSTIFSFISKIFLLDFYGRIVTNPSFWSNS
jgi:hypothetical protein